VDPRRIFGSAFGVEVAIAAAVFVLVCAAVVVALLLSRRRRRRGLPASSREERPRVELVYGLLVAAVAGFVVFLSFRTTGEMQARADPPAARVNVTAFQWCWAFRYPGSDVRVTGTCSPGEEPVMVVPAGRAITVHVTSTDVEHSWWVPDLRYKMDAFPDHTNAFTFTVDRPGEWEGLCAEFCGDYHYSMHFRLRAVSPERYRAWLASGGSAGALGS